MEYIMYCDDVAVATFQYGEGRISVYTSLRTELLPIQIRLPSSDALARWIQER